MKISVPKPCNENWDKMLPEEQGRFCLKCTKTVVDFSKKTKEEVHAFFRETTEKVCGRFESSQLEQTKTTILPSFINITRTQKFAFALYLVFGSFLFSCSENNNQNHTVGEIVKTKNDTIKKCEPDNSLQVTELGEAVISSDTLIQTKKQTKKYPKKTVETTTVKGDVKVLGEPSIEPEIHQKTMGIPRIDDEIGN